MRFRSRLTYSNVIAAVALFIALGGISYAATKLPKNSVDTKQIKNKAVTKAKLSPKLIKQLKGKTGPDGKNTLPLKVLNADGSVLGQLAGTADFGEVVFEVLIDGGIYSYLSYGQLYPSAAFTPLFRTNTCDGTAYLESDLTNYELIILRLVGGPTRVAFRALPAIGPPGPISAWKITATHETVAAVNIWKLDSTTGACVPDGTSTGELTTLESVPAPPDGIGPLKISP